MEEPSQQVIEQLKAQHSDRSLHLIELQSADDSLFFVMTGPNRADYKKFQEELIDAKNTKDEKERGPKLQAAIERAALAQIRWPEREQVKDLFDRYPTISANFAEELHKAAGDSFEVRSKKL